MKTEQPGVRTLVQASMTFSNATVNAKSEVVIGYKANQPATALANFDKVKHLLSPKPLRNNGRKLPKHS